MTLAQNLRLEKALRFLADNTDQRVTAASGRYGVPSDEIWLWLKQNNMSRPHPSHSQIDRAIENAKRLEMADGNGPPKGMSKAAAERPAPRISPRPAPLLNASELPKRPALDGPGKDPLKWLEQQEAGAVTVRQTVVVLVTPAMAARWLTLNQGNRKPSRAKVRRFADVIRSGKWMENGETVKFSASGRLLDGQSRLRAIIEANTAVLLEIRFGIPDTAQRSMDAGESRRATHALEMLGYENAYVLSPALRFVYQMELGGIRAGGSTTGRQSVMENLAVPALIKRNEGLTKSVAWAIAQGAPLRKLMPFSEAAFFHYIFAGAGVEKRDAFFQSLIPEKHARLTGRLTKDNSPTGLLRNRLLANLGGKISAASRVRIIVKAWNAYAREVPLAELTLTPRENCAPIFASEQVIKAAA